MSTPRDPLANLIRAWSRSELAESELTARKLLALARGELRRALHGTAAPKAQTNPGALGGFLGLNKDTLAEGFRIRAKLDTHHHTQLWRLERMSEAELRQPVEPVKPAPANFIVTSREIRQEQPHTELVLTLNPYKGAPTATQIADAARLKGAQAAVSTDTAGNYRVHVSAGDPARLETVREALTQRFGSVIVGVRDGPPVAPTRSTQQSRMAALGVSAMSPTDRDPFVELEAKANAAATQARAAAIWRRWLG